MSIEEEIANWCNGRPTWQRDVIARLCKNERFDEDALQSLAEQLIDGAFGTPITIEPSDIPGQRAGGEQVRLAALKCVDGVNALAKDQELEFGSIGLTIIYGDNASGKSGYARLIRNAVGARVQSELLRNVFSEERKHQTAIVEYVVGDEPRPDEWKLGEDSPPQLSQIQFYDQRCGSSYVSTAAEIGYRPSALGLLDDLIWVCEELARLLDQQLLDNRSERLDLPQIAPDTEAGSFLLKVGAETTPEEVERATTLDPEHKQKLAELLQEEARFKSSDPVQEKRRLEALATECDRLVRHCEEISAHLGSASLNRLDELIKRAKESRAAAKIASQRGFDSEPINGVGSETWRMLWQAARRFSEEEAYKGHEFPHIGDDSHCVLCQQLLAPDARDRLKDFDEYMSDTTEREAREAEVALQAELKRLQRINVQPGAIVQSLNELRTSKLAGYQDVAEWLSNSESVHVAVKAWTEEKAVRPEPAPTAPTNDLNTAAEQIREQASKLDDAKFRTRQQELSRAVAELQAASALASARSVIDSEISRLKKRRKIEVARQQVDTTGITRKTTDLIKTHVTRAVRDRFTRETEFLKLRNVTLDPTAGKKGTLEHQPALVGATSDTDVDDVLSEGEQTALGLAGFVTEAEFDTTKSALVFDDPVTSLDHIRRALVAKRLVELARDRPVVVFTHAVTFVGDLVQQADEADVNVTEAWVTRRGEQVGFCSAELPWKAKDVASGLQALKEELATLTKDRSSLEQADYDDRVGVWAGRLSELWERAVRLEIVFRVFDRGTSHVQPKQVRLLAQVTDNDNQEFQSGYSRASLWATRHDKDEEVNYVSPDPDEMKLELERFETWFKRIRRYKNN